jgi:4-hydroxy-tetrahydrodipicolinate synthase
MTNIFKGTGVALVTPFQKDLQIDFDALEKLVEYQIENGTDFLVVLGTTGESPTLSKEEKWEVLDTVLDVNEGRCKVVFGVGGNDTMGVARTLEEVPEGVDGILSVSPFYNKPTQKGILAHYRILADSTDLPIILYNVPGRTGSNVLAETTLALSEISNIVAIKEASGDLSQIMQILKHRPKGFAVLSGDDNLTVPMISLGAEGVISVVANAFPRLFSEMVSCALEGDFANAKQKHFELFEITNMFFEQGNPGGVKASLAAMKRMEENMRLPLFPINASLRSKIEKETHRILSL